MIPLFFFFFYEATFMTVMRVTTYLLAIQCIDPLHHTTLKFNGFCNVSKDLLEGVGRFLIEQDTHSFAWLDPAPHHRHKLGTNEILSFSGLTGSFGSQWLDALLGCWGLYIDRPVGVDVLCVVNSLVEVLRSANIALTWEARERVKMSVLLCLNQKVK